MVREQNVRNVLADASPQFKPLDSWEISWKRYFLSTPKQDMWKTVGLRHFTDPTPYNWIPPVVGFEFMTFHTSTALQFYMKAFQEGVAMMQVTYIIDTGSHRPDLFNHHRPCSI